MFHTGHNTPIALQAIPEAMLGFYNKYKDSGEQISIIIGTDSQNFSDTKMVSVVAMICERHGGIFFYEITHQDLIRNIKQKLQTETAESLTLAGKLIDLMEKDEKYLSMYTECLFAIHVDAGNSEKGKTKMLIPELVGWVRACGYNVKTKPESFVASSIADRLSK